MNLEELSFFEIPLLHIWLASLISTILNSFPFYETWKNYQKQICVLSNIQGQPDTVYKGSDIVRKQLALPFESNLKPETKYSSSHGVVQVLKLLNLLERNFQ
jgi:hypothetical protein